MSYDTIESAVESVDMADRKPRAQETDKRRTKGDGAFYQRADGIWIGRVEIPTTDNSRRYRQVASKDRNVAMEKLKRLRADVLDGRIAVTSNTTVAKWLERWLTEVHGPELRPTTYRDYRSVIDKHIVPHIGHRRLDKLTPEHVRGMHAAIESSRNAQKAHIVLQRALKDAVREGMLTRNVAEVVHKPRHTAEQREPLTADQARTLLKSSIDNNDPMATRWAAALLLGARQGELLGLQWSRLDLINGVVDLRWQLQQLQKAHGCGERQSDGSWPCGKQRVSACPSAHWDLPRGFDHQILHNSLALTPPKSKAGTRVVPVPAPLWEMLKQHPRGNNPHDLVWHHDDGRPISPRDDYDNWQAALKAAGLPPAPLHVARHTTATLLLIAGVDEATRMQILGHSSAAAQRGYAHIDQTLARRAMTALDQLLS